MFNLVRVNNLSAGVSKEGIMRKGIIMVLMLLHIFTGCSQSVPEGYERSRFGLFETRQDLALELVDYSTTGITLLIHNRTDEEKVIGEDFWLEKKINLSWYLMSCSPKEFPAVGLPIDAYSHREWSTDWSHYCGELEEGEYRVVKDNMSMEFSIE